MSNTEIRTEPEAGPASDREGPRSRQALAWLAVLVLGITALVGSNAFSIRDRLLGSAVPEPAAPAPGRVAGSTRPAEQPPATPTALRSQPWWQTVHRAEGTGPGPLPQLAIDSNAIQWRVSWTCESGSLSVVRSGQADPLVDGMCPGGDPGYGTGTGPVDLEVAAGGSWTVEVEQQIDAPLVEPPAEAMTAPGASVVASGTIYGIDRTGQGRVIVYREADGGHSIRLEDFFVTPNVDLELRLSTLAEPKDSPTVDAAPSELITVMDVTAGSLNYPVPDSVDPTQFQSVVIWCEPIVSAYAAASLEMA